jgi:hypothetical protein
LVPNLSLLENEDQSTRFQSGRLNAGWSGLLSGGWLGPAGEGCGI